jgi:uncharacterized repeat protein (TIGR01451 family)
MKRLLGHKARGGVLTALALTLLASVGGLASFVGGSAAAAPSATGAHQNVIVGHDSKHDLSPALRTIAPAVSKGLPAQHAIPVLAVPTHHASTPDAAVQSSAFPASMPATDLNFEGIDFPGVNCNCAPPDTNGEVGATQYVQIVNEGIQVFDKSTGTSVLGPISIASIWTGFGGLCETSGSGDPVALYDQLANRWLVSQFAISGGAATDECIAVSTSSDATGSFYRYDFHLGSNFYDYPKIGVWPDAYYMSMNVFNTAGTSFLGPQPFAFDRSAMLTGSAATFVSPGITNGPNEDTYLPADLDGSNLPPAGAPETFVEWPGSGVYKIWHFHVDFVTPANSTFTLFASPAAAGFTQLSSNVPQLGTTDKLDNLADRLMFRAQDRFFPGHESLVTNYTVSSGGVAGVRWLELRDVTAGPVTVYQESTYQPDSTWRWMGSAAMDEQGDIAVGFSASSASMYPAIGYAGRLVTDPLNTLAQGETTLYAGTGSQTDTASRWGDYSDMTVDPVDGCTFWYTNEYYSTTSQFNWRTRIGSFHFPSCTAPASVAITKTADAASVGAGSQIGFTVTLTNSGAGAATGLAVTDALPAGSGVNWSIDGANTDAGWSVSGSPPNQSLVYSPTVLAGNSSTHVHTISATTGASCGTYDNTASFTTDNGGSGQDSASETVSCGTITVVKHLVPSYDPGRFNLRIDGTTYAPNVGNNGTTGQVSVSAGNHTVSETAGTSTNLGNYVPRIVCSDGSAGYGTSLSGVHVAVGDDITCTITNTRRLHRV